MLILGLSSLYKDHIAAALVRDGAIEAALENYKLQPDAPRGIPEAAIQYCLSKGNVTWGDIDAVAIASAPFRGWGRRAFSRHSLSPVAPVVTAYQQGKELSRLAKEWTYIRIFRQRLHGRHKVISLDHHCCHAASAFFLSPFHKALILTLDGEGDGNAGLRAVGEDSKIRAQETIPYSNSIGWVYSLVTERLGMRSSDKWEHLAEILRAIEPALERKLDYCRANPPDPVKQPVTSAVVTAYVSRVELELATIRGGVRRLKDQLRDRPGLTNEILEIESWILRRRSGVARPKLTAQDEQALGDWFVSKMGFSYSETRQRLAEMQRSVSGKGAPNKKIETLKLLDARICNGWSYQELARRMCDCGSSQHADYCADRIRKRVGELVAFLKNYGIEYSRPAK
jgi:hypothetical protein